MGRPTKLTEEVTAKVLEAIRCGNTRRTAAAYAGIGERTLHTWMVARGAKFRQFQQALEKAEGDAIVTSVALIRKAAQESWQAAAWWLERRYPEEWGRKDRMEIEHLMNREAERIAKETGLPKEEIVAQAERILAGSR